MERYLVLWSSIETTDSLGMPLPQVTSERTRRDFHEICDSMAEARALASTLMSRKLTTKTVILKVEEVQ